MTGELQAEQVEVPQRTASELAGIPWQETQRIIGALAQDVASGDSVILRLTQARFADEPQLMLPLVRTLDPNLTGYAARYEKVAGSVSGVAPGATSDEAVIVWGLTPRDDFPKVVVPDELKGPAMKLAEKVGMKGGQDRLVERADIAARFSGVPIDIIRPESGAKRAPIERLISGIYVAQAALEMPMILMTAASGRILKEDEHNAVSVYAPKARNEFELTVAAVLEGLRQEEDLQAEYRPDYERPIQFLGNKAVVAWFVAEGLPRIGIIDPPTEAMTGIASSLDGIAAMHGAMEEITDGTITSLDGARVVDVTNMHYAPRLMPIMTQASAEGGFQLADYAVVGELQPETKRPVSAHVIEFAMLYKAYEAMTSATGLKL